MVDGERRRRYAKATLRHAATTTTTEVGFPPLHPFFESFLEISLRYAKSQYGNHFRSSLFIEICFSCWDFKMVHECACNVRGISERRMLFQFFGSVFYLASNGVLYGNTAYLKKKKN